MIENQYTSQPLSSRWHINDFSRDNDNRRVIRKFINSAIYVEKAVTGIPPSRKTSPLSITDDFDENGNNTKQYASNLKATCKSASKIFISRSPITFNEIKSCNYSSASNLENNSNRSKRLCQEAINLSQENGSEQTPESGYRTNNQSSNHSSLEYSPESSFQSQITVKPRNCRANSNNELRLSLTCLNTNRTDRTATLDPKEKQEIIESWLAKKESEIRHKSMQEAKLLRQKEEERQQLIEKERETFKKWLAEKKKEEERKKIEKEIEEQELKLKEAEKEKRKIENEISFNLWLRKKKKYDLERKIREKIALINMYEKKQNRLEENENAYQEWLENAKSRPKPIPMNQGLQSLCSSASVTYINPQPWTPNIDLIPKSSCQ